MKKKVIVKFEDGELIFRNYEEDDNWFKSKYGAYAIKITRQYYPLKSLKEEVIFSKWPIYQKDYE